MLEFVTDKRFIVGLIIGVVVVPYGINFVKLQLAGRTGAASATVAQ